MNEGFCNSLKQQITERAVVCTVSTFHRDLERRAWDPDKHTVLQQIIHMCCTILASLIGKQCVLFSANIKQKGKLRNIGQHSSWWLMIAEEISPQKFDCPLSNTPPPQLLQLRPSSFLFSHCACTVYSDKSGRFTIEIPRHFWKNGSLISDRGRQKQTSYFSLITLKYG